jgi:hypothetical protein
MSDLYYKLLNEMARDKLYDGDVNLSAKEIAELAFAKGADEPETFDRDSWADMTLLLMGRLTPDEFKDRLEDSIIKQSGNYFNEQVMNEVVLLKELEEPE